MKHSPSRMFSSLAAFLIALLVVATASAAGNFFDVQANAPQISDDPSSDTTAVFPTNKQNEPTIAVNPLDRRYLIAGSNDEQRQPPCGPGVVRGNVPANDCSFFPNVGTSGIYTSSNGGTTWTNRGLLDDQASWVASQLVSDGDPVIAYGPKPTGTGSFSYTSGARAYYATLASYKNNNGSYPPNKAPEYLAVSYSDDNGITWSAPVLATTKDNPNDFNDKEWITVDDNQGSPYFGRVYVSWTEFRSARNGSEPIMVSISTDGGASFDAPKQISPAGNNGTGNGRQGSMVTTGPDGSVYIAFVQGSGHVVSISRDGGQKWTRPINVAAVTDIQDPIPGANFRTDSFLSIAADPRSGSTTLYIAWAQRTADGGRIWVTTSNDRAVTWSAPQQVSTAAEGYAFFQGLDVASTGRVDLAYQSLKALDPTTFGTGNATIDSYYVSKSASGSWSAPRKISTASSDPAVSSQNNLARQFFGDYNVLVSSATKAWFIYTDTRNGAGCPAIDQYQRIIAGTETVRGDMGDRIATRLGQNPYSHEPGEKPAPTEHCNSQFGNSNAFVSVITP